MIASIEKHTQFLRVLRLSVRSFFEDMAANFSLLINTLMLIANESAIQEQNEVSYNNYFATLGIAANKPKCYGSYGCFELNPPWTSDYRPVSVFPENLKTVHPSYPFYNRKHPDKHVLFDLDDHDVIGMSKIDPQLPIYIISHGFMENGYKDWIIRMKDELLKKEDCSIIVVNWEGGSSPPYTQAVANIRLVGAITAHLLADLSLKTGKKKLDHVHCIGHSLGAHLCGYVGYTLQKDFNLMLGRISGLDPAEPHFAKNKPPVRLDRSAAKYVDVIHTDASSFVKGGFGIIERVGHVDFYPNGGENQPGCTKSFIEYFSNEKSFFAGMQKFLGCNHIRSYEFFIESINLKCKFMTISCSSYEDFQNGKCMKCGANGNHCMTFGLHSNSSYKALLYKKHIQPQQNLVQYFMTGATEPYCRSHYKITVKMSDSNKSYEHGGEIGQLWFVMHSTSDGRGPKTNKIPLNPGGYHGPGDEYIHVVPGEAISKLKAVEIELQYNSVIINPLTWRILAIPRLYVMSVEVVALEIDQSIKVCPKDNQPLMAGYPQLMLSSYCT